MSEREWVIAQPKKMRIEPEQPKPAPVFTRWERFCFFLSRFFR
jgi:hypothetical protein